MKFFDIFSLFSAFFVRGILALCVLLAGLMPVQAGLIRDTEIERGLEALAWPMAEEAGLSS